MALCIRDLFYFFAILYNSQLSAPYLSGCGPQKGIVLYLFTCSRRSDSGERREVRGWKKKQEEERERGREERGREEGTLVRLVFQRSFRPLCRLTIQPQVSVLKVVNQATGDSPHCLLNYVFKKYVCIEKKIFYICSFCKRIYPLTLK